LIELLLVRETTDYRPLAYSCFLSFEIENEMFFWTSVALGGAAVGLLAGAIVGFFNLTSRRPKPLHKIVEPFQALLATEIGPMTLVRHGAYEPLTLPTVLKDRNISYRV
jgi:hypothetical protein